MTGTRPGYEKSSVSEYISTPGKHDQRYTKKIDHRGSGSAGGGEGVVDDFFVVESGPTVEVGQGDGLFVIPKVYQITGLRADGYAILLQFWLSWCSLP